MQCMRHVRRQSDIAHWCHIHIEENLLQGQWFTRMTRNVAHSFLLFDLYSRDSPDGSHSVAELMGKLDEKSSSPPTKTTQTPSSVICIRAGRRWFHDARQTPLLPTIIIIFFSLSHTHTQWLHREPWLFPFIIRPPRTKPHYVLAK